MLFFFQRVDVCWKTPDPVAKTVRIRRFPPFRVWSVREHEGVLFRFPCLFFFIFPSQMYSILSFVVFILTIPLSPPLQKKLDPCTYIDSNSIPFLFYFIFLSCLLFISFLLLSLFPTLFFFTRISKRKTDANHQKDTIPFSPLSDWFFFFFPLHAVLEMGWRWGA